MINVSNKEKRYDFIVVGGGAAGSVLAARLSASGPGRRCQQQSVREASYEFDDSGRGSAVACRRAGLETVSQLGQPMLSALTAGSRPIAWKYCRKRVYAGACKALEILNLLDSISVGVDRMGRSAAPSAIMITRSRRLLKLVYQATHKMMIGLSKCRP